MIEFNVFNRFTGKVQFVAKIDCGENAERSIKLGLAVRWALNNGASLSGADLRGASLFNANLRGANLSVANLSGASLFDANLSGAMGERKHIKNLQIEDYSIVYTAESLQIGCKRFPISEWWEFTDDQILTMDGNKALEFWRKWKDWLRDLIEVRSPAEPTGYVEKKEGENQ